MNTKKQLTNLLDLASDGHNELVETFDRVQTYLIKSDQVQYTRESCLNAARDRISRVEKLLEEQAARLLRIKEEISIIRNKIV